MYVTRRLLRSTLEETTAIKSEPLDEPSVVSPRKRRPLLQTEHTREATTESNPTTTSNTKSNLTSTSASSTTSHGKFKSKGESVRDLGLHLDARDTENRWCEAKVMRIDAVGRRVYIHYVGWSSRYDCWLETKRLAAHGSHTGAKTRGGKSWNGKDSLFALVKGAKASTKTEEVKVEPGSSSKSKKRQAEDGVGKSSGSKMPKVSPAAKKASSKRAAPVARIEVGVDAVDEESERTSRRGGKDKIDLELEMDVGAESTTRGAKEPKVKSSPKRSRTTASSKASLLPRIVTAKSPTAATRKPSPRRSADTTAMEGKSESDEPFVTPSYSPTVGMSELRRSARASLAARNAGKKKRKLADDDDSDEDYQEEEDEDEEDEDDDDDDDEVDDSDDDLRLRRASDSSGKTRRSSTSSSSALRRSSSGLITQWQTDPAYSSTRARLSSIFRQRLIQRGDINAAFHGSFQHAMSESSPASTPRTQADDDEEEEEGAETEEANEPKKKRSKKAPRMSEEEKAAAARYYYAQHYYQMQALQYHQYLYHQALMAQQLEHQRAAAQAAEKLSQKESNVEEEGKADDDGKADGEDKAVSDEAPSQPVAGSTESSEPVMDGGIIDPRFIHARMDALEEQKRIRQELYMQHYTQATERNLHILASGPEYLKHGQNLWREQVQQRQQPKSGEAADDSASSGAEETQVSEELEEKSSVNLPVISAKKDDEARQVEDTTSAPTASMVVKMTVSSPEATPEATHQKSSSDQSIESPPSPDKHEKCSNSGTVLVEQESEPVATPSPTSAHPKTETVLYELVL